MKKIKPWMILLVIAIIVASFMMLGKGCSCGTKTAAVPNTYYTVALNNHVYYAGGINIQDSAITLQEAYALVNGKWLEATKPIVLMLNPGDTFSYKRNQ